jgi:uncharacterized protein
MGVLAADNRLIEQLRELLERQPGIACAYLFGSVARGAASSTSDIDLAVLLEQPTADTLRGPLARLRLDLEDALGRPVDLVALETAPPDLIHRVLRDGVLLVDQNPNRRIAFEVRARNDYFDLLPYLTEYRRAGFG